jgi:hypothetical protein
MCVLLHPGAALGAEPENVHDVLSLGETMLGSDLLCPLFHGIRFDLGSETAVAADQMMMMPCGAARTVEAFAIRRLQRVGVALDGKVG